MLSLFSLIVDTLLSLHEKVYSLGGVSPPVFAETIGRLDPFSHFVVDISEVTTLEFYDERPTANADMKNIVVFGKHQVDRSPCGTGTCAKMAMLSAHGKLGVIDPTDPFKYGFTLAE